MINVPRGFVTIKSHQQTIETIRNDYEIKLVEMQKKLNDRDNKIDKLNIELANNLTTIDQRNQLKDELTRLRYYNSAKDEIIERLRRTEIQLQYDIERFHDTDRG